MHSRSSSVLHPKASGVLISIELFEESTVLREKFARRDAVASAWGSVTAEGLVPTGGFTQDADEFTEGSIDADELARRAIERHSRRK
jgi:Antitoxin VbhA